MARLFAWLLPCTTLRPPRTETGLPTVTGSSGDSLCMCVWHTYTLISTYIHTYKNKIIVTLQTSVFLFWLRDDAVMIIKCQYILNTFHGHWGKYFINIISFVSILWDTIPVFRDKATGARRAEGISPRSCTGGGWAGILPGVSQGQVGSFLLHPFCNFSGPPTTTLRRCYHPRGHHFLVGQSDW